MRLKTLTITLGAFAASTSASAYATVCPTIGASSNCSLIITRNADGSFTSVSTGVGPYDGNDDTLIGVVNNGPGNLLNLSLSSSTDIFGFDGDGINSYSGGGNYGVTGYEGPGTSFTVTDPYHGLVNFLGGGIAPGASAYFALEEDLSGSVGGTGGPVNIGGGTVTGAVPEPSLWVMMIGGFGMVGGFMRRRSKAALGAVLAVG